MKKTYSILLIAATTIGLLTSCSDVPMPYDINAGGTTSFGKTLPYKSASLSTFTTYDLKTGYAAWSQGSSYTQATGYQAWNGASTKSNVEVESYLISPALNTTCESGQVRISFDQTLRYTNNVSGWQNNHKIYMSKDFDGNSVNFDKATWTQLSFTPEASPYSDWTLYSSGYLQVPDEFVGHDSVYVAFYFYAPATASTTWELENFLIEEGVADNSGGGGTTTETAGSKEAPLTVAEAKTKVGNTGYVTGYIVGYVDGQKLEEGARFEAATESQTELLLADSPDETDVSNVLPVQLPTGDIRTKLNPATASNIGKQVVLYGSFENYFGVPGMKSTTWALMDGESVGKDPDAAEEPNIPTGTPSGTGTAEDPYNVAAVYAFAAAGNFTNSNPSDEVYVKGIVSQIGDLNEKYSELNYYISDDGTTAGQFYVYNGYGLNGEKITSADYLKVGDVVLICGKITTYSGTHEFNYGSKILSINGSSEGGGDTPTPTPTPSGSFTRTVDGTTLTIVNNGVTTTGASVTYDFNELGYDDQTVVESVTLSDGTTLTFNGGTNSNAPKFFAATKGIRVYGDNNIIITGSARIAKVEFSCDSNATNTWVGNENMTFAEDGNTLTICNAGGTTQLRIQSITITYAE